MEQTIDSIEDLKQLLQKLNKYNEKDFLSERAQFLEDEKKTYNITDAEQLERRVFLRLRALYKRQIRSTSAELDGILIGMTQSTDFGAQKEFDEAIAIWKSNQIKAFEEGYTDKLGHPLYHKQNHPVWKKGKPIDVDSVTMTTLLLLAKTEEDEDYVLSKLSVHHSMIDKYFDNMPMPFWKKLKLLANIKTKDESGYTLTQASDTKFEIVSEEYVKAIDFVKKYLKQYTCDFKDIRQWVDRQSSKRDDFVIIKGCVFRIALNQNPMYSTTIEIDRPDINFEDSLVVRLPSKTDVDFIEGTENVIILGRAYLSKTGNLMANAYSYYVDDKDRIKKTNIYKDDITELKDDDVVYEQKTIKPSDFGD